MKRFFALFWIALSVLFSACERLLDVKPQDFVSPETYFNKEADATAVLNSAFDILTDAYVFGGYYQGRMLVADDYWCVLTGTGYPGNLKFDAAEPIHVPRLWDQLYKGIEYCNIVLKYLPEVSEIDEVARNTIRGEALFLRGFLYFQLVDQWGPVPLRIQPTAGPEDIHLVRAPINEIYDQILLDMTEAESLLPTTSSALYGAAGYPAKTTAQGMLARVCLTMAGAPLNDPARYQEARDWAQKVIESGEHSLNPDYSDIFINLAAGIYDKKEILWEIDFNDVLGSNEHGSIGYLDGIPGRSEALGNSIGRVQVTRVLFDAYGGTIAATDDLRRDWNCGAFTYTDNGNGKSFFTNAQIYERWAAKFRLEYTPAPRVTARSPINFPILRYADILLMWAEADNFVNQGPSAQAYAYVNQVRARAYGKLLPGATDITQADIPQIYDGNPDGFLEEVIKQERFREFPGEALRKHDLIRWGDFVSAIKAMGDDARAGGGSTSFRNRVISIADLVSERDVLWPIPYGELTYNKLATQNPGW